MSDILKQEDKFSPTEALDRTSEDSSLNRVIKLRSLDRPPIGEEGKLYYDKVNSKVKLWINSTAKWADLLYTTTSTSSTSTSSTSTSTS